jgi:flagellin
LANLVAAVMTGGAGAAGAYYTNNGTAQANPNVSLSITSPGVVTAVGLTPAAGNSYGNNLTVSANLSGGAGGVVGSGTLTGGTTAVSLLSASGAQLALQAITNAIGAVASQRGAIGSGINEMNAAVLVMNNTSQNLTSSLSGIQDANIGQVVANMSKYQVLEQTGISALAQSNQQEQAVLKLLQ